MARGVAWPEPDVGVQGRLISMGGRGWGRRAEREEEEEGGRRVGRRVGRGGGGGGGGFVRASSSYPSRGKFLRGQGGMEGWGEESVGEEGRVVLRSLPAGWGEGGVSREEEREEGRVRWRWPPLMKLRNLFFSNCSYLQCRVSTTSSDMS